jgi:hypothetical protein
MTEKVVFLTYRCQICNRFIPRTEPFFEGTLELVAGTNQLLADESTPERIAAELQALTVAIEKADPRKLEEEVYLKRQFRLCPMCRQQLLTHLHLT